MSGELLSIGDITWKLDSAALEQLLHGASGPVGQVVADKGRQALSGVRGRVPVRTGTLLGSVDSRQGTDRDGEPMFEVVARAPHWVYVEYGTRYVSPRSFLRATLRAL